MNDQKDLSWGQITLADVKASVIGLKSSIEYNRIHCNHVNFLNIFNIHVILLFLQQCLGYRYISMKVLKEVITPRVKNIQLISVRL